MRRTKNINTVGRINNESIKVSYSCVPFCISIITYIVLDSTEVNAIHNSLRSGFTVLLGNRIKAWSANIIK